MVTDNRLQQMPKYTGGPPTGFRAANGVMSHANTPAVLSQNQRGGSPLSGPVAANQQTRLYGDGRITEADGGRYNFARPGIYDLLNDKNIDVCGNFDATPDADRMVMDEAGFTVGDRAVNIHADGTVSMGSANPGSEELFTPVGDGQNQDLGNNATLTRQGNTVTVTTPEYTLTFDTQQQAVGRQCINLRVQTGANGVYQDGQLPTGVLGETFDPDDYSRSYVGHGLDGADPYQRSMLPGKTFTWDPHNGQAGYVQMLYGNLLGHPPLTDDELHQISRSISQDGLPTGIKQILHTDAFNAKGYSNAQMAAVLYKAVFQKVPDQAGIAHYVEELNNGQSLDAVVDEMLHTPDYYAEYNNGQAPSNMSNKEAVQTLYSHFNDIRRTTADDSKWWAFDRYMHRSSLEAVTRSDQFDAQTKAAAKRVLDNNNLLRKLDAAEGDHGPDDKIGTEDFEALLNDGKLNTY